MKPPGGGPGARCAAAAVSPHSINMELENIVANTVLLKAREGKDGEGGVTAPLHRCVTVTAPEGCPGLRRHELFLHFLTNLLIMRAGCYRKYSSYE